MDINAIMNTWLNLVAQFPFKGTLAFLILIGFACIYRAIRPRARYRVRKSKKLLSTLQQLKSDAHLFGYLRKIDPFLFEELILSAYEAKGFQIKRNARYTGDGGIDGRVKIGNDWHLVQAKRYKNAINPGHVKAFSDLCMKKRKKGLFIHTGRTGPRSRDIFNACPKIKLISGSALIALLRMPTPLESQEELRIEKA